MFHGHGASIFDPTRKKVILPQEKNFKNFFKNNFLKWVK